MIQCPSCGQALRFDIPSQQMVCDACDNHYDPSSTATMNKDATGKKLYESYVFTCPSCGGELMTTDEHDAIGFCPFCGGASMIFERIHEQWEPEYIIPFRITKERCKELYEEEAKRSFFTSRKYADPRLLDGFRGIYMPYWCYQAIQKGEYRLQGKKNGLFTVSEYRIKGHTDYKLDGYAHDAAQNFDDRISEEIAPFDPSGHKPFAPGYLSGFYADIGDVNAHSYEEVGRQCMTEETAKLMDQSELIRNAGGGMGSIEVDIKSAQIPTTVTSAKRALYPVWFMSYRNQDKITYAAVNGQTGKVTADLPLSPMRILIAVLAAGALIAGILFSLPSMKANTALLLCTVLLVAGIVILAISARKTLSAESGLRETEEAKRFLKADSRRMVGAGVIAAIGLIVSLLDLAYNLPTYLCCIALAATLFTEMIFHIRFQAEIAKRRPPQFDKKGAQQDEG